MKTWFTHRSGFATGCAPRSHDSRFIELKPCRRFAIMDVNRDSLPCTRFPTPYHGEAGAPDCGSEARRKQATDNKDSTKNATSAKIIPVLLLVLVQGVVGIVSDYAVSQVMNIAATVGSRVE